MTDERADMSARDARGEIAAALDHFLTPEQVRELVDEVLTTTKSVYVDCRHCGKKSAADVPDAKAVVGAIAELLNQAKGRPTEQKGDTQVVVERRVELVCGSGQVCACEKCKESAAGVAA